jgi:hypothetical protein
MRRCIRFPLSGRTALLLALAFAATARCADREAPAARPMPSFLAGVRLGMSLDELRRLRPGAQRFEIFGEPEVRGDDPNPLYLEELRSSPFFDTASYAFCARKLCSVTLSSMGRGELFADREAKVLQGSLRKWGSDAERLLSVGDKVAGMDVPRFRAPALLWKLDSLRVLLTFSPFPEPPAGHRQAAASPGLSLSIFDPAPLRSVLRQDPFKSLVSAPPAEEQRLFALLNRQVQPPLFD